MTVVRQASGKWRPIIENIWLFALAASQLFMECINVIPQLQDAQLLLREAVISPFLNVLHCDAAGTPSAMQFFLPECIQNACQSLQYICRTSHARCKQIYSSLTRNQEGIHKCICPVQRNGRSGTAAVLEP